MIWCNFRFIIFSVMYVVTGYGVVIVKNGQRICGSGAALANAPIVQNKAYFEAKLQSSGNVNCDFAIYCLKVIYTQPYLNSFCFMH